MSTATSPADLSNVVQTGAVAFGLAVAEITITLTDGRTLRLQLPTPKRGEAMTPTERKILSVLGSSSTPLTRKCIAMRCGRESAKGSFGRAVKKLLDDGRLYESADELTDDLTKFDGFEGG